MKKLFFLIFISIRVFATEFISCQMEVGSRLETKDLVIALPNQSLAPTEIKIGKNFVKIKANYVLGDDFVLLSVDLTTPKKIIAKTYKLSRAQPLFMKSGRVHLTCKDNNIFQDVLTKKLSVMKFLKSDPNHLIENERLLYYAVRINDLEFVNYLLSLGSNPLIPNPSGNIPIMAAAMNENLELLNSLFEREPSSINVRNKLGWHALMFASKYNQIGSLKFLINNGAFLDIQDRYGRTALMIAAKKGNVSVVAALLSSGAQVDLKRSNGMTAYMLATKYGHDKIVLLLRNAHCSEEINLDLKPDFDWDLENEESYYIPLN